MIIIIIIYTFTKKKTDTRNSWDAVNETTVPFNPNSTPIKTTPIKTTPINNNYKSNSNNTSRNSNVNLKSKANKIKSDRNAAIESTIRL